MFDSRALTIAFVCTLILSVASGCGIGIMSSEQTSDADSSSQPETTTPPSDDASAGPSTPSAYPSPAADLQPNNFTDGGLAANDPPPTSANPFPVNQAPAPAFHLSAGAALPQSLPMGTVMSFSVDYQQRGQLPTTGGRMVWVISCNSSKDHLQPVALKSNGTLTAIVPGLRPEAAPFECHLAVVHGSQGRPQKISNTIPLR